MTPQRFLKYVGIIMFAGPVFGAVLAGVIMCMYHDPLVTSLSISMVVGLILWNIYDKA